MSDDVASSYIIRCHLFRQCVFVALLILIHGNCTETTQTSRPCFVPWISQEKWNIHRLLYVLLYEGMSHFIIDLGCTGSKLHSGLHCLHAKSLTDWFVKIMGGFAFYNLHKLRDLKRFLDKHDTYFIQKWLGCNSQIDMHMRTDPCLYGHAAHFSGSVLCMLHSGTKYCMNDDMCIIHRWRAYRKDLQTFLAIRSRGDTFWKQMTSLRWVTPMKDRAMPRQRPQQSWPPMSEEML